MRYNTSLFNLVEPLTKRYTMGKVLDDWRRCRDQVPVIEPVKKELTEADRARLAKMQVHIGDGRVGYKATDPHIPADPAKVRTTAMVNDLQYVTRFDHKSAKAGWVVRIGYGPSRTAGDDNYWHKKFNDEDYDHCCWKSLADAMAFRDECVAQAVVMPNWRTQPRGGQ